MIRALVERNFDQTKKYVELAGLSTDSKPTSGIITGCLFYEVDTGVKYMFDETGAMWNAIGLTEEEIKAEIDAWLDDHPEATTTVEDGAISRAKLDADLKEKTDAVIELKSAFNESAEDVDTAFNVTLNSGYIISSSTGLPTSAGSSNYVSNPIDIEGYGRVKITARSNYSNYIYAFYDANDSFIAGRHSNGTEAVTQITDMIVDVPENAKYLRISKRDTGSPESSAYGCKFVPRGLGELSQTVNELNGKVDEITGEVTYQVDYVVAATWSSGYVAKTGEFYESSSYVHTNKISVLPGDRIYLIYSVSGSAGGFRFVTAYEGDRAKEGKGAENVGTGGFTVPDGIDSVILSVGGNSGTGLELHLVREISDVIINRVSETDLLFGKKWCICGDSFTYGGQSPMPVFDSGRYKGSRKSYPYFIGNRTYMNIVDFSENGRTLAYPQDGTFSNALTNPNASFYYQNIPADVDYITIYLGINDSHHAPGSSGGDGEDNTGEIPIGTVDDNTTATFGGAWNVVLTWLITNRPNAHIGIIVSNGVDNVNYRNLTIDIAKKYGIAYIDLNGDERTPAMLRTVNPNIASAVKTALINKWAVDPSTNTHPNTDAHEYESFFIENFLRSI